MKTHSSISHFSGAEQQALRQIKNRLVQLCNPLLVYLLDSESCTCLRRHCFAPKEEDWRFKCSLLLVLPDEASLPHYVESGLKNLVPSVDKIDLIAVSMKEAQEKIKQFSLFFCWVQRKAVLLHQRDNALQQLPEPVSNIKAWEQQARQYFAANPAYENYGSVLLSPLPVSQVKEKAVRDAGSILPEALQHNMVRFLEEHKAKAANIRLRRAMIGYVHSTTDATPHDFDDTLWDFEDLMALLDLAEKHGPQQE